jgi:hypothetical protein
MASTVSSVSHAKNYSANLSQASLAYRFLILVVAALYGAVLSQIPDETFKDFANYLVYAEHSWVRIFGLAQLGPVPMLANEPIWLLLNAALGIYLPPESVVRFIIFFSASFVAWLVLRHHPRQFFWIICFLLLPMVMKNNLIHLRQGAAIAVFLWGWYSPGPVRRWLWMGLAPLIHASFFFVLALLFLTKVMQRLRLGADIRALGFLLFGFVLSLSLAWVAELVDARQAQEYEFSAADISGLGFLVWFAVAVVWMSEGRSFLKRYAFETGIILFYLSTYWFIEVTARIFESGLILVLIAGLAITQWRRFAFLAVVLALGVLSWLMRLGQAGMGFVA